MTASSKEVIQSTPFRILVSVVVFVVFISTMYPLIGHHALAGDTDESFYTSRAMENIQFLQGIRSADQVTLPSSLSHPFTVEFIVAISLLAQHMGFIPTSVWVPVGQSYLDAARITTLMIAGLGLSLLVFFGLQTYFPGGIVALLFLVSSPGFLDYSIVMELDIYLAMFTAASLICLYYYLVKGQRKALWIGALFLGLAFGSKISWDPIIASVVFTLAILGSQSDKTKIRKFRNFAMSGLLAFAAFAATSPLVIWRLSDQLNNILSSSGGTEKLSLSNLLINQPLVNTTNFSIFTAELPLNIGLFLLCLSIAVFLILRQSECHRVNSYVERPTRPLGQQTRYVLLIGLFVALDLVLTAGTFEYGRNYIRLSIYEGLFVLVFLWYVHSLDPESATILALLSSLLLLISLGDYLSFIPSVFTQSGYLAGKDILNPSGGVFVALGWLTFLVSGLAVIAFASQIVRSGRLEKRHSRQLQRA